MECKKVEDYLSMYFDGKLGAEESSKVEEHIKVCAKCKEILTDYTVIKDLLRSVEEIEPRDGAFNQIRARIIVEEARIQRRWRFVELSLGTLGLAAAGILLIVLLRHRPSVDDKFEIARNLEVLQNMELIQNLDFYEYLADEIGEDI